MWPKELQDYAEINPTVSIKGLSDEIEVSFIPMEDVSEGGLWKDRNLAKLGQVKSGFTRFLDDDTIIAKITPCFENGKGALIRNPLNGIAFGSTEFHVLRPKNKLVDPRFIYYVSQDKRFRVLGEAQMVGSAGQRRVQKRFIQEYKLPAFSSPELEKVSDILDSVSFAVDTTEALIAKYEQIKQGMMQGLFTRGVDENGQLRAPYEDAPHLYKETELGWLPNEWEVKQLQDILHAVIDYRGKPPPKSDYGIPLITAKNVRVGYINPEPQEFIPIEKFDDWMRRGIPQPGDVIFTTEAPLGYVAQIPEYQLALGQRTITLQPKKKIVLQDFLKWLLMSHDAQKRILEKQSGSTAKGIQQKTFVKMKFLVPSIREQQAISRALNCIQNKVDSLDLELQKMQQQKAGLMQGLLTGKVRVSLDHQERAEAVA